MKNNNAMQFTTTVVVEVFGHNGHNCLLQLKDAAAFAAFCADQAAYVAQHYGLAKHEFLNWCECSDVQCAAVTKAKKRCRKVAHHRISDPVLWHSLQGSYCCVHEG